MAVALAAVGAVPVWLAEGAESGFAHIMEQYLQQNLEESQDKRRTASRLRGRVAMTALDHGYTVTLVFQADGVAIWDGEQPPLDASIAGPYETLLGLIQGKANPVIEHVRGRIKVKSRWRRPFLPLRVHGLLRLEDERDNRAGRLPAYLWVLAAAGIPAGLAAAIWLLL